MKFFFTSLLLPALLMFNFKMSAQVNYSLVCVDSVWYETGNPILINVRIFNGDTTHMNYPSVQIISPAPANDTIGNPSNYVNYFAHLSNIYLTYTDTITQQGIPDFSSYTFLMNEGFGAFMGVIGWCGPTSVEELKDNGLDIFPNPVANELHVTSLVLTGNETFEIYDALGRKVLFRQPATGSQTLSINLSNFTPGIYFIRVVNGKNISGERFIKQ